MSTVSLSALTAIVVDAAGEEHDMNANGTPCADVAELRELVIQLCDAGAYGDDVQAELLASL